jgi:hypothetical protein
MKLRRCKRTDRAGYALVLFVMIVVGLMGLAALVIDMGFSRLAQREMQTAVDSAALEGLRWRDFSTDQYRRRQASDMVAGLFTDYVDSGGTVHYGAGPVVDFSGGIGPADMAAAQTMTPGVPPVYQPTGVQLNLSNAAEGDMVAGTYNPGQPSAEGDDYTRADFTPAPSGSSTSSAFLVRLRRTNNTNGLDQEPGVSSGGPTLPIMFGRGSLMARSGSTGQLSVASGVTVRAAAIAAAMPAKSVGPGYSASSGTFAQLAPFAISNGLWNNSIWPQLSSGGTVTVNLSDPGVLSLAPTFSAALTAIGQQLATTSTLAAGSGNYVPIYDDFPSQSATIIGFVYVQWSYDGVAILTLNPPADSSRVSQVGSQNVSGCIALPLPANLSQQDISLLFQDHAALANPLCAPVLVNHYIGPNP